MKAKSIRGNSIDEIREELIKNFGDGFNPTLAITFISKKIDHLALTELLDYAGLAIFGATTNGSFISEDFTVEGASILLLEIDKSSFCILPKEFPDKNYRKAAHDIARRAMEKFDHPTFLITSSNTETDAEELLIGFADVAGENVEIYGGGAGDDFTFTEQIVFTNGFASPNGVVVLTFDAEKVIIHGKATCGWNAVGTVRTVTKSEGNHVYTVDDIPVLDLTVKYGGIQNVTREGNDIMLEIASIFPLQMQREKGDPVMRPGLKIDWNDGSFYCSGSVPQGSKVRFSLPPDFDVVDKVINAAKDIKATVMPEADAVIVFSCAGRQIALGPMIHQEISGIQGVWNVPMVGMFSNAELGRATGGNLEMHNLTTCVVALKEL